MPYELQSIELDFTEADRESSYPDLRAFLAHQMGLAERDIEHYALLLLAHAVIQTEAIAGGDLVVGQWRGCGETGCDCGGYRLLPIFRFALRRQLPPISQPHTGERGH